MAVPTIISISKLAPFDQPTRTQFSSQTAASKFLLSAKQRSLFPAPTNSISAQNLKNAATILGVTGVALATLMVGPDTASASEIAAITGSSFQFNEPSNALSLPTWAIHVSSVVEWVTAMALVWQYGEKSGNTSWKGLSWGMVLVALQAALTVLGNATMCIAAFRIYRSQEQ